ncbi:hypothetical protein LTR37_011234 [Vermiconidia calcicola]|uniref:Uncharacterized protein n=1 Tax=Vermiconidia calcicola TaxID=1690605 RepID=A0ACC3N2W4_9PEZI|nr:hypothetical protein LTR37_011234 [Vermiconidia calcicola]
MQQQQRSMQYSSAQQHASEAYRDSPQQRHHTPMSMSHAPLLPPIQHFPGAENMQSQPQYAPPAPMNGGAQMPQQPHHPPPYHANQFQYSNGAIQPAPMPSNGGANGQNMMRYAIPPQASVQLAGGGRPKKDIKRRTKTGCLTCRKRRIKCDESHPACRNCQKSKRECLGYDPIFKQQPAPAAIQPAPSSSSSTSTKSSTSTTIPPNLYQQFQPYPGVAPTFVPADQAVQSAEGPYEYGAPSLDPALSPGDQSLTMATNSFNTNLSPVRKVKFVMMEQLYSLNDVPPRYQAREAPPPPHPSSLQEVDDFYRFHFGPGLDKLFETNWYGTCGLTYLKQEPHSLDYTIQVMEQMKMRTEDAASVQSLQSLEARLVWQLAMMPRSARGPAGGIEPPIPELLSRLETLECILTGQFLSRSTIPSPPAPEHQHDHARYNQYNFWHQLGRFAAARDDTSDPSALREINDSLAIMRGILGMMENRDVMYSIAIARHIGGRSQDFLPPQSVVTPVDDMNSDVKKLQVAQHFVSVEDQKGTTQVIQRVCGMAIRGWILQKQ